MELDAIKEAFDRVAEKRALSSARALEVVDQIIKEIQEVILTIQTAESNPGSSCDYSSIFAGLKNKLGAVTALNLDELNQKELNAAFSKYFKLLEKSLIPDIAKAYRHADWDVHTINLIIANHFYREGLFDLGDRFVRETHESDAATLKPQFQEMYQILEAMRARNLEPALSWAARNYDQLSQNGSLIELKLHQLQFVEVLTKGSKDEALQYARTHLVPFTPSHTSEIQKLVTCLLWYGRLDQSPYAEFTSSTHWEKLAEELTHQFCSLLGQSQESPLNVAITAGVQVLPTLLKMTAIVAMKKQNWQTMKQLPLPLDLGPEFQFHSVFVCPVLKEQSTEENPPMLMPCGHVLSKQSVLKLSKNSTRSFKCPYCPLEASVSQCKQLYF